MYEKYGKGMGRIKIDSLCNLDEYMEQEINLKEIIKNK